MNEDGVALRLRVNGADRAVLAGPGETLLTVLREGLGLTGAKRGCDQGVCGACTVLADGRPIRACLALGANVTGLEITTVEGLAGDGPPTPLQQAFIDGAALQCGFCTPGMIVSLAPLFAGNARPGRDEIREAISGNLCRCTGYAKIVAAAATAAAGDAP